MKKRAVSLTDALVESLPDAQTWQQFPSKKSEDTTSLVSVTSEPAGLWATCQH